MKRIKSLYKNLFFILKQRNSNDVEEYYKNLQKN